MAFRHLNYNNVVNIPVDFIFVEVSNLQTRLGYAIFSYPDSLLHAANSD